MKNRTLWTIIFAMIILFFLLCIRSIDEDSWICTDTGWMRHGNPKIEKPIIPCGQSEERAVVEKYVSENISNLSPQKEVLGGNFYVTNITWIEDKLARVEYEDGHIALKAIFDYKITSISGPQSYKIEINNFKIYIR